MLTYPSDSLPQIVCPMDGDAIPPNPFCSAPPHSEPPPPLLPLSSVTPSRTNDGIPGQRRSGRIQGVRAPKKKSNTDGDSVQEPSRQNPPPTKRQREAGGMVQVSQSKQLRAESTQVHVKQNEDGLDWSCRAEHTYDPMDQESHGRKATASATGNVDDHCAYNTAQTPTDVIQCDMDTSRGLDTLLENASAPKGWVIGPLFQSFKSKMASFTEIVMSPVKLFKANSPPPSMEHPEKLSDCELPADIGHLEPGGQSETSETGAETEQQQLSDEENAQNTKTVYIKYSKKVIFDEELSTPSFEKTNKCAKTHEEANGHDSVPLQHSPILCFATETVSESVECAVGSAVLLQTSVDCSSSHKLVSNENKQTALLKPLPRKRMGNGSESKPLASDFIREKSDLEVISSSGINKAVPLSSSDCDTQPIMEALQLDGDEGIQMETCDLIRQGMNSTSVNGKTVKPGKDLQKMEYSATGQRAKRGLKLPCHTTGNIRTRDANKQELMNVALGNGLMREPPRREAVLTRTVDTEETLKPSTKRKAHSTRPRKEKRGQEMPPTVIGTMLKTEAANSPQPIFVCSLNKSSDMSENLQNVFSSIKMNPRVSCKRLKTRAGRVKPELSIDDGMDLETTVAISSAKEQEVLSSEVFIHPDVKLLQSKHMKANKKTLKRKSPVQANSVTESDGTLVSTSSALSVESELMATDLNVSLPVQRERNIKTSLDRPKRPKKGLRDSLKPSESNAAQEKKHCINDPSVTTKKRQAREGGSKFSTNPVYFEMTPSKSSELPVPSCSQPPPTCPALHHEADEAFPTDTDVSKLRSSARKVNIRPRGAEKPRGRGRVLHSRTRKGAEVPMSVTMEDADLATTRRNPPENCLSRRLLRSYSCPEIPSFRSHDAPAHPSRTPTSHHHQSSHTPHAPHPHKSVQRARRHTVCSVEVEREIAPLCLRKEVYPSRRSAPYDFVTQHLSPTLALSPSTALSALASCFLSSPLAFLSKKADSRWSVASPSTSSYVSPPTFSSSKSPFSSSTCHLPGFHHCAGSSHATLDPSSSTHSLECESQSAQQCEGEYGEDTSCSSQEYEDVGLREEKALSDSEIKAVQKHEERGKVSSIRIRKTLPKPQNNLTPMGLPKPIRLKKKDFSLEEIYTNKNFSKPPESRLETIFEVPLNRRNGSESWFGQRRVKRFLEFLEAGEVRKPKKPLVGVGKPGNSSSRTRRGAFSKDEPSLTAQDVDSLLCAKLDELNLWLINDQNS